MTTFKMDECATVSRTFVVGTVELAAPNKLRRFPVEITVSLHDALTSRPKLSIVGNYGNDNHGGGGQCIDILSDPTFRAQDFSAAAVARLAFVWSTYHLNGMQAACEHQRDAGWTYATHQGQACPIDGYVIGSKWLYKPLPADVLDIVRCLLIDAPACRI